jgi:hypothetical protein
MLEGLADPHRFWDQPPGAFQNWRLSAERKLRCFLWAVTGIDTWVLRDFGDLYEQTLKAAAYNPSDSLLVPAVRADLLRDLFGNPWKPPAGLAEWSAYRGGAVRAFAQSVYDGARFTELPFLADLLEEAGCTDAALLGHLRRPALCPKCNGSRRVLLCDENDAMVAGVVDCWVRGEDMMAGLHIKGCWALDLLLGKN